MVALSRGAFARLRDNIWHAGGDQAPAVLQEMGYGEGPYLHQLFVDWCARHGYGVPENVAAANFSQLASAFFDETGWGTVSVTSIADSVMAVDSANWCEAGAPVQYPSCYLSSGMLADFFSRLAGAQLVSMEVECRTVAHERCRFIIASAETIQHVYEAMAQGVHYEQALTQMA
jgi:predicted hydrocarbon binding protein